MRFLFFCAQYLPTVGGVERYTYNLCRTLSDLGHSSTIITSELKGLDTKEENDGITIYRLPCHMLLNSRFPLLKKNRVFYAMIREVFESEYDIAVVNTRFYPLSLFGVKECKRRNIFVIVIEHGSAHLSLGNRFVNTFIKLYEHIVVRMVQRYCSYFYGVSLSCNEWLRHFGITASGVIYNAVDMAKIEEDVANSDYDIRKHLGLKVKIIAVFSGRFLKEKGIYELLEAFRAFNEEDNSVVLVMAGSGPLYEDVKRVKTDNVYLTGQLQYIDSLALLNQSDIFVLPTYSEGFSTVTLEAAALGKCIISTYTGGNAELISDMISGILLRQITANSIYETIRYVLEHDEFRRVSGEKVKQSVEKGFSWSSSAKKLLEIAKEIGN